MTDVTVDASQSGLADIVTLRPLDSARVVEQSEPANPADRGAWLIAQLFASDDRTNRMLSQMSTSLDRLKASVDGLEASMDGLLPPVHLRLVPTGGG